MNGKNTQPGAPAPSGEEEQAENGSDGEQQPSRTARVIGWLMMSHYLLVLGIPASLIVHVALNRNGGHIMLSYLAACGCMTAVLAAVPPCRRMIVIWAENHARVFQRML